MLRRGAPGIVAARPLLDGEETSAATKESDRFERTRFYAAKVLNATCGATVQPGVPETRLSNLQFSLDAAGPAPPYDPGRSYCCHNAMGNIGFAWNERKARSNLLEHGVSFEEAQPVFLDVSARLMDDPDHSQNENLFLLLGSAFRHAVSLSVTVVGNPIL